MIISYPALYMSFGLLYCETPCRIIFPLKLFKNLILFFANCQPQDLVIVETGTLTELKYRPAFEDVKFFTAKTSFFASTTSRPPKKKLFNFLPTFSQRSKDLSQYPFFAGNPYKLGVILST